MVCIDKPLPINVPLALATNVHATPSLQNLKELHAHTPSGKSEDFACTSPGLARTWSWMQPIAPQ